jgi:hypothetical protein
MRLVAWNLNHRAARRSIPQWIDASLLKSEPDIVILTEYVEASDHERFVSSLAHGGLSHVSITARVVGENQLLVASRELHVLGNEIAPNIHKSVPPNALHVTLVSGIEVLGFRMPAFEGQDRPRKRDTCNSLLEVAARLAQRPAVIAGDFNTAFGDSKAACGDCLDTLTASGWRRAPADGCTWRHTSGTERCIDHAFVSSGIHVSAAQSSWEFQELGPEAKTGKVGLPDHAMIIVDCQQAGHE